MAKSIVSSMVFFLLVITLSLLVDGKVFAVHRKLNGAVETMTMKRNLQEGGQKTGTPHSVSPRGGQKNINKEPSKTSPNKVTPQHLTYKSIGRQSTCNGPNCIGVHAKARPCQYYYRCRRAASNSPNNTRS